MIKFKFLYFVFIFFFPAVSCACSCAYDGVVNNFQQSEFVAKAKIIKITRDPKNPDYHDAVIDIINLYKGPPLSKIKIISAFNSSCSFLPSKNTTWIIFAQRWQGMLSFGFCSGSIDMDRTFDSVKYPHAVKNHANTIKLKEGVISFLAKNKIANPNPSLLQANNRKISLLRGYKNENGFAVFQVDVNADFSIAAIKQLQEFQNENLNKLVYDSMKMELTFTGNRGKPLAKPTSVILFCFYYQNGGSDQSFLSFIDI